MEFKTNVMVLVDGKLIWMNANSFEHAEALLIEHLEEKGELEIRDEFPKVMLVNYTHTLDNYANNKLKLEMNAGELDFNDVTEEHNESQVEIVDSPLLRSHFDDMDELEEYLQEQYKAGEITLDEIKHLTVIRKDTLNMEMCDVDTDDPTFSLEIESATDDEIVLMGATFENKLPVSEDFSKAMQEMEPVNAPKPAEEHPLLQGTVNRFQDTEHMTLDELNAEIQLLQERLANLLLERRGREVNKADHF